jgi:hypothetical protein
MLTLIAGLFIFMTGVAQSGPGGVKESLISKVHKLVSGTAGSCENPQVSSADDCKKK